ncbi:MAG: hypothetical protein ACI88H_003452 [Cocleimonas sp.]|jgi:hypothetical protein
MSAMSAMSSMSSMSSTATGVLFGTVTKTVAVAPLLSLIVYVKVSIPVKFRSGV